MAESRLIQKQLAGKEDLLLGVGTVSQARATGVKTITKLNATHFGGVLVVDTINDLNSLDKNQLDEQVVLVKEDGYIYIYNGTSWVTKTTTIVENIESLKTLSTGTTEVLGYYTKGDGGGGLFYWDSTSTETDNGGTIIQATGVTTGRWQRIYSGAINPKWFGAKDYREDSDFDNTSIFMNILNSFSALCLDLDTVYRLKSPLLNITSKKIFSSSVPNLNSRFYNKTIATILCDQEFLKYTASTTIDATNTLENINIKATSYYTSSSVSDYVGILVEDNEISYNTYNNVIIEGFKKSIDFTGFGWLNYFSDCIFFGTDDNAVLSVKKGTLTPQYDGVYNVFLLTRCVFVFHGLDSSTGICLELGEFTNGYGFDLQNTHFEGGLYLIKNNSFAMKVSVNNCWADYANKTDITPHTMYNYCSFIIANIPNAYFMMGNGGSVTNCVFRNIDNNITNLVDLSTNTVLNSYNQAQNTNNRLYLDNKLDKLALKSDLFIERYGIITSTQSAGITTSLTSQTSPSVPTSSGESKHYRNNNTDYVEHFISSRNSNGSVTIKTWTGNNGFYPSADNTLPLGKASNKWSVVYAGTATINTSDDREKTYLDITEAERLVAIELKENMKKFKFNNAIESKGEKARIHFGASAQTVKSIFEKHGLIAEDYSILCYDEWEEQVEIKDEEGNIIQAYTPSGNRYGLRYEELLCFIISAI